MMEPKCPYCDFFRSNDRDKQKRHLKEKHPDELQEIAKRYNQTVHYAAGCVAFTTGAEKKEMH